MIQGKDYFTGREIVKAPLFENEIGLQIQKSNTKNLTNTWCGIFGFERYRAPNGSNVLAEYFAFAMIQEPSIERENLKICQIEFEDIIFKAIALNGKPTTILPIVKTNVIVNVEIKI